MLFDQPPPRHDIRISSGFAPGKVIVFGEHAVVYGRPAVAASVSLGLTARCSWEPADGLTLSVSAPDLAFEALDVRVHPGAPSLGLPPGLGGGLVEAVARCLCLDERPDGHYGFHYVSALPPGRGMGSSAALAVATIRGLAKLLRTPTAEDEVARQANIVEEVFHGTPSGVDCAVISRGGVIAFEKGPPLIIEEVRLPQPVFVALIDSGVTGITKDLVGRVRRSWQSDKAGFEARFDAIAALTRAGVAALSAGDYREVGTVMNRNHQELVGLGVSTDTLDALVNLARAQGALGAKLTGAGGGGLVMAVAPGPSVSDAIAAAARNQGFQAWSTVLGGCPNVPSDPGVSA